MQMLRDLDHGGEGHGPRRRGTWTTEARDMDHGGEGHGPRRRTWTTETDLDHGDGLGPRRRTWTTETDLDHEDRLRPLSRGIWTMEAMRDLDYWDDDLDHRDEGPGPGRERGTRTA
ncbi:hypothetical protein RRG08_000720 [Elysia crispata]|uniref:Uncharacterized protein n=1 Tax=Elysia crispata TaxID=231223 RepID=A0AAE1AXC1_9GAST|nr:hypothetical protein RRG08_000720 [Elysia crispata]